MASLPLAGVLGAAASVNTAWSRMGAVSVLFVSVAVAARSVALLVLSTLPRPTIEAVTPPTVPVKVGLAMGALRFNSVWVAVDTGLLASEVLSTLLRPTSAFTIPVGVFITGLVKVLLVSVSVVALPTNVSVAFGTVTTPLVLSMSVPDEYFTYLTTKP